MSETSKVGKVKAARYTREQMLAEALRRYKNKTKQSLVQVPDFGCKHRFEDKKGRTFVVHAFPGTLRVNWSRDKMGRIKYHETPAPASWYLLAGQEGENVRVWLIPMKVLAEVVYNAWRTYEAEQKRLYNEVTFFPKTPSRKLRGSNALFIGEQLAQYEVMGETKIAPVVSQVAAEEAVPDTVIAEAPRSPVPTLAPTLKRLPAPVSSIKGLYYPCRQGAFETAVAA